ncbi:EAL domain-containing protein [Aliikangiella marina]|uniref:EAL domain-containing protein n=1 Tax=Aliikangiella marina TaxID=1712262 RepID=A0A545T8V9_9GAMM|nr:EAL domain-containing protein [Aliikangiella marina]TQV73639.1 EAL domain-containing protein [Aliikangiella marina]
MHRIVVGLITCLCCLTLNASESPDTSALTITASERSYLATFDNLRLCTSPDAMPLDDIVNGKHIGIGAEYINLFARELAIDISLVETESWEESLASIQQNNCDIIGLIAFTPQRSTYLNFTDTYVEIPFVLVTTQEKFFVSRLSQLVSEKLGVLKGYAYVDLLKNRYPNIELVEVDSRMKGLQMVSSGELFGYFSGLNLAGFAIQEGQFTNLKINGQFDELSIIKLGLGVRKDLNPLIPILNKTIAAIPKETKQRIDNSWLTVRYEITEDYQRIIQFFIVTATILIFVFYRQYHLRKLNKQLADREQQIWKQANYDFLTELPNRRLFNDRLEQEINRAKRTNEKFALLLIDLDEFKDINDTQGHEQGDNLLVEAAKRVSSCLRKTDTIARLGGDEFVVILKSINDLSNVEKVANKILDKLQRPFELKEESFISASIGITICPDDSNDIGGLLRNADQAMYAAKADGRNKFHYFTSSMQHNAQERANLIRDLRIALQDEQFEIYYQPIEDLRTGEVYKAEALIRWNHPENGLVSPISFIPLLEETRMIIDLGDWIFTQAAKQAQIWRDKFHDDFQVNVNTSPLQFQSKKTKYWYQRLQDLNISPGAIGIEITESMLMEGQENISEHLIELRDQGFQVALDDFGTGYSSLAYLKKFDIDYLKIDKSFVNQIAEDSDDKVLCEAIIIMAHRLGLDVVAEGIETEQQKSLLKSIECDYGQGYHLSKPLPKAAFDKYLEERYKVTV